MDLAVPISLLVGFIGYQLNKNGKVPRNSNNIRDSITKNNTPSSINIYNSVSTKQINQEQQQLSNERYKLANDPVNTNIISNVRVPVRDSLLPSVKELGSNPNITIQQQITEMEKSPMFNPPPYKVIGKVDGYSTESSGFSPILQENFGNVSQLTGLQIDTDHTNMVPHFGSSVKQNMDPEVNQGILERYTGVGGLKENKKREVETMFKPTQQNIYGHHFNPDRSRNIQSGLKTNQLPVPQVRVSPLPAESNRPQYRTNTQRNVNARVTNLSVEPNAGISHSQTLRGNIGVVSKNRPETTWELGQDRLLVGSTLSAPTARENFTNGGSSAAETAYNVRPAGANVSAPTIRLRKTGDTIGGYLETIVRDDNRNTGHTSGFRNISGFQKELSEIARGSYIARENERATTSRMTLLPAGNSNRGEYQTPIDEMKVTMKQTNLFSYTGGAVSSNLRPTDRQAEYNTTRNPVKASIKNYIGNPTNSYYGITDNSKYENMEIRSNKDTIADNRNYSIKHPQGIKESSGQESLNVRLRDATIDTPNSGFNFTNHSIIQEIADYTKIGQIDHTQNKSLQETDQTDRIDPLFVSQLNSNPYAIDILE